MRPRLVDWSLLVLVLFEAESGLYSFLQGRPENSWLFVLHGVMGLAIVLLLLWKLQRVWRRVAERRRWDGATWAAVAALGFVLLAIATGRGLDDSAVAAGLPEWDELARSFWPGAGSVCRAAHGAALQAAPARRPCRRGVQR